MHDKPQKAQFFQSLLNIGNHFTAIKNIISGRRYKNIPHLWHRGVINIFAGELLENLEEDGSLKILFQAAPIALADSSGMCYWWLANRCCILITKISDLKSYQKFHDDGYVSRAVPGVSKIVPTAILFNANNEEWRTKRKCYSDTLYNPEMPPRVRTIIANRLAALQNNSNNHFDLQDFIYETVLYEVEDLFMRANPDHSEFQQAKKFALKITTEGFDFQNIFKWMLPQGIRKFIQQHPNLLQRIMPAKLQKIFYTDRSHEVDFQQFKQHLQNEFVETFLTNHRCPHNLLHNLTDITKDYAPNKNLPESDYAFGDGVILLLAGLETSASSIMFATKLLCKHPEVVQQLRKELQQLPTLLADANEDEIKNWIIAVNELPYLDGIVKETLRLYPPTPVIIPRPVVKSFTLGEVASQIQVAKEDYIIISPWVFGRNEKIWPDAERFKPERWQHENLTTEQKQSFVPFGFGHHLCIGKRFAENTAKLFLTMLFSQYDLHLSSESDNDEVSMQQGSLKPKTPLKVKLSRKL